jgi:hydrogenase/urease accessory protein HupE
MLPESKRPRGCHAILLAVVRSWFAGVRRGLAVLYCGLCLAAFAHDPGISTAQGELSATELKLTTGFAPADAQFLLPPSTRQEEKWTSEQFEEVRDQLVAIAPRIWEVRSGDATLAPRDVRVELLPGDNVSFYLVFPRDANAGPLVLRAPKISELPSGHRQFVVISNDRGTMLTKKLLKATDALLEVPLAPGGAAASVPPKSADLPAAWEFVRLGVEHIWTGFDHLLFLFALLVVCRSFRSIVAIISCFTIAHSLTLALATLNIVNLPSRWVEAVIAASIVFVGVENLLRRGEEPRGRWALTFAFGLIHGFGFASVLRDLGVGAGNQGIAMPLVTFNVGVEIGQIIIAAIVLPIVWQLRKREGFVRRGVPILSAVVALAGLYWLIDRTVA